MPEFSDQKKNANYKVILKELVFVNYSQQGP